MHAACNIRDCHSHQRVDSQGLLRRATRSYRKILRQEHVCGQSYCLFAPTQPNCASIVAQYCCADCVATRPTLWCRIWHTRAPVTTSLLTARDPLLVPACASVRDATTAPRRAAARGPHASHRCSERRISAACVLCTARAYRMIRTTAWSMSAARCHGALLRIYVTTAHHRMLHNRIACRRDPTHAVRVGSQSASASHRYDAISRRARTPARCCRCA